MEKEFKQSKDSLTKAEVKVEVVTEYFQQKEANRLRALDSGKQAYKDEMLCTRLAKVMDARDEECNKLKQQLDTLQHEFWSLELSYIGQINEHVKKTNEAVVSTECH